MSHRKAFSFFFTPTVRLLGGLTLLALSILIGNASLTSHVSHTRIELIITDPQAISPKTVYEKTLSELIRAGLVQEQRVRLIFKEPDQIWIKAVAETDTRLRQLTDHAFSVINRAIEKVGIDQLATTRKRLQSVNSLYASRQMELFALNNRLTHFTTSRSMHATSIDAAKRELTAASQISTILEIDNNELWSDDLEALRTEARVLKQEVAETKEKMSIGLKDKKTRLKEITARLIPDEIHRLRQDLIMKKKAEVTGQQQAANLIQEKIAAITRDMKTTDQELADLSQQQQIIRRAIRDTAQRKDQLEKQLQGTSRSLIKAEPVEASLHKKFRFRISAMGALGLLILVCGVILSLSSVSFSGVIRSSKDLLPEISESSVGAIPLLTETAEKFVNKSGCAKEMTDAITRISNTIPKESSSLCIMSLEPGMGRTLLCQNIAAVSTLR